MNEIQQNNIDQGWEPNQNPPPVVQFNAQDWENWPEQGEGIVDENELAQVENFANAVVANAVMKHPDQLQHSSLVSSDSRNFFRAEGPPVTLELPLPVTERSMVLSDQSLHIFQSDSHVRELASTLGLHQAFGPAPSVEMLIAEMAEMAEANLRMHMTLPLKGPVVTPFRRMIPVSDEVWELCIGNPLWGNNAEASTSHLTERAEEIPRLLMRTDEHTIGAEQRNERMLVPYDENFAIKQIMENLHPGFDTHMGMGGYDTEVYGPVGMQTDGETQDIDEELANTSINCNTITPKKKRRTSKAYTPIVDDEVRRSARLRNDDTMVFVQLESEPRRRKGEAKKTVRFSTIEDLKKSIIGGQIGQPMEVDEVEPIEVEPIEVEQVAPDLLVGLGTSFCGVPLGELTVAILNEEDHD